MINLDGLTVVGPGSEWFWTMLQVILLVVTGLVIWRQLRAQAATNAIQQLDSLYGRWHSGLFTHAEMELALHIKHEGVGADTFWHAEPIIELIDDVGRLYAAGYVRIEDMSNFSVMFQNWWLILRPVIEDVRSAWGAPLFSEAERIVTELSERDARLGLRQLASPQQWCDEVIRAATFLLTRERDWKAGILPSAPVGASVEASSPA
jgi:hypothetical protein